MIEFNSKTIANRIKELLLESPALRDNDLRLIANFWAHEINVDACTVKEFLQKFVAGEVTAPESIRRLRQKLQETMPELRGERYKERQLLDEVALRAEIKEAKAVIEIKQEARKVEAKQVELISG